MFLGYICKNELKPFLQVLLVFFVLEITAVYSFFNEKLDGKPDVYNLISSASFAIMSLCLSKLSHSGIEFDVLNLQLMKLKLYLVFAGAVFNFFLIMLRFYLHKVGSLLPVTVPRDLVEPTMISILFTSDNYLYLH